MSTVSSLVVSAQLSVNVAEDPAGARMVASWYRLALARLGGDLGEALLAAGPLDQGALNNPDGYGPPGSIWAHFWALDARGRSKVTAFSEDRWAAFLAAMEAEPRESALLLVRLNSTGFTHTWPFLQVQARPSEDFPDWWFLDAHFPEAWMSRPGFDDGVAALLAEVAAVGNPSYGHLTYRFSLDRSALEEGLALIADETIATSRTVLRGYSWLTVLSAEQTEVLGGAEALRASGAFFSVTPLPAGGVLLRATEQYEQYGFEAAERIFPVLAPVLPAGEPRRRSADQGDHFLSYQDASTVR